MSEIDAPSVISRDRVMEFVRSLGINPDQTVSLTIDPTRVELVLFATNEDGKHFCHPGGNDVATHTIALEIR